VVSRGWDGAAGSFCAASAGVPARCGGQWARLGAWAPLAACGGFAVFLPQKISELEIGDVNNRIESRSDSRSARTMAATRRAGGLRRQRCRVVQAPRRPASLE
jgi:hypothetical protein